MARPASKPSSLAALLPLDALPFAAWLVNAHGQWENANERAMDLRAIIVHDTTLIAHCMQVITTQEPRMLRAYALSTIGHCHVWISPLAETTQALVMLERDATHSPHADVQTRTDLSVHMAASLAHEIRNPLLSIKGAAQLLEDAVSEDDKTLAQLIVTEAARIEALMAALDPLSPTPEAEYSAVNIHEVLEYVRHAAEASFARHVTFVLNYDPSLPPLRGMQARLIQVLMNLLKNAAEACSTRDVPHITLSTRYIFGEQRKRPGGKNLPIHVMIADNGTGIAESLREHLFTPFMSNKAGGKGLGLSLAAAIIAQHGGLIDWDSSPEGTRFHLYFAAA